MKPPLTLPDHVRLDECRHGTFASFRGDIYVGKSLATYGEWCESEVALFGQFLRPGDVVVEAGANIGSHSVPIARRIGDAGRLIALEPQAGVHQLLSANLLMNGQTNVTALTCGAGAEMGEIPVPEFDYSRDFNYGGVSLEGIRKVARGRRAMATVWPLDKLIATPALRLIKADVEGMEADLIRGALGLIRRHRPILYLENDRPEDTEAIFAAMAGLGYQAHWHLSRLFNPKNWRGVAENIFGAVTCINILFTPETMTIRNLPVATGPGDHPKRKR